MTDDARGDAASAMRRLPRGSAVVYRDYARPDRAARGAVLRALARKQGLVFLVAGDPALAQQLKADGFHAPEGLIARAAQVRRLRPSWIVTVAAHGRTGLIAARRAQADAAFLSPVFPTASHPGGPSLGPIRFALLAQGAGLPVLALGGMNEVRWRRTKSAGAAGYGAIAGLQKPSEISVKMMSASRSPT